MVEIRRKSSNQNQKISPALEKCALCVGVVEAGGIEPPSERFQAKASTCLSFDLDLAQANSQGRIKPEPVPKKSRSARPEHARQTSSLSDVRPESREHGLGER